MGRHASLVLHGVIGWAICGATVAIGRKVAPMTTTLIVHAVVAPLAFGLLTRNHVKRFPESSPPATAIFMVALVIGLDALVVAPLFEQSYEMFRSVLGTWLPFALIVTASYFAARAGRKTPGSARR
jgi:hypothetical protein